MEPFENIARLIEGYQDGMASYSHADNKIALGFVEEGLNNKTWTIQKRAYAFQAENYPRLKTLSPAPSQNSEMRPHESPKSHK